MQRWLKTHCFTTSVNTSGCRRKAKSSGKSLKTFVHKEEVAKLPSFKIFCLMHFTVNKNLHGLGPCLCILHSVLSFKCEANNVLYFSLFSLLYKSKSSAVF